MLVGPSHVARGFLALVLIQSIYGYWKIVRHSKIKGEQCR